MIDFIDYSQYADWCFCVWKWYEKTVLKRRKAWPAKQRDDALAIGSLVHSGLENWYAKQDYTIGGAVIERISPTIEALRLSQRLITGYVNHFPQEQWSLIHCEAPLRFPVIQGKDGLAKLDLYFYIDSGRRVESGLPGYEITLKPGWWIQEYKTKSSAVPTADFMQEWVTKMQADFQMLALQEHVRRGLNPDTVDMTMAAPINGLLVNVIEKPKEYVPKRKCQNCGQYWAFSSWLVKMSAAKAGNHVCPSCGNEQKLKPVDSEKFEEPRYFRMIVERTAKQLAISKDYIETVARNMQQMEVNETGPTIDFPPNKEHCFDNSRRWGKECEFFRPHTYGFTTIGHADYEATENYINEPPQA